MSEKQPVVDALLAMVQMPADIPVASMAVGPAGARNVGLYAVRMLATIDKALEEKLKVFKQEMAAVVVKKAELLRQSLQADGFS